MQNFGTRSLSVGALSVDLRFCGEIPSGTTSRWADDFSLSKPAPHRRSSFVRRSSRLRPSFPNPAAQTFRIRPVTQDALRRTSSGPPRPFLSTTPKVDASHVCRSATSMTKSRIAQIRPPVGGPGLRDEEMSRPFAYSSMYSMDSRGNISWGGADPNRNRVMGDYPNFSIAENSHDKAFEKDLQGPPCDHVAQRVMRDIAKRSLLPLAVQ